jgi:hypothetical protein
MVEVIGAGGPMDRASIGLSTRRGTNITNERRLERAPAALRAASELWKKEYPNARLRSATAVYNCMGLVFASRRTWIDPVHLAAILKDDDYRKLAGPHEVQTGDIVVYLNREDRSASHVGVVVKIEPEIANASWNIMVMSQWGADGEYFHFVNDVPKLLGEPNQYWTDRRLNP